MDLYSKGAFKSLPAFSTRVPLPDFVVITGVNGSGKTHLLQGLAQEPNAASVPFGLYDGDVRLGPVRFVDSSALMPKAESRVSRIRLQKELDALWEARKTRNVPGRTNPAAQKQIAKIARLAGKPINRLTKDDFETHLPMLPSVEDVFDQKFADVFMRYHIARTDNELRQMQATKHPGDAPAYLTEEEFVQRHGEPPWQLVNQILARAGFAYELTFPKRTGLLDVPFELRAASGGLEVPLGDLSSGERVLMALGLAAYSAESPSIEFPKVLLLDEPDAHLHPLMVRQMLDVLQDVFVKQRAVKVILTTHSPSTVALAPEGSLFAMSKTGARLASVTKDAALALLTAGVPSVSVLYENRRQVFVESDYDAGYLENLYSKLRQAGVLAPDVSLAFISSGIAGTGNCDAVRLVVTKLRASGNRFVWGVVDWDGKAHASAEGIVVLGLDQRYSIENYLLDPVVLGALLLRDKVLGKADVGLEYFDLAAAPAPQLQGLANYVVARVEAVVGGSVAAGTSATRYHNGSVVQTATWYLHMHGHSLEKNVVQAFPQLQKYGPESFKLKREVVKKVLDDIPGLIPMDLVELFRQMQA